MANSDYRYVTINEYKANYYYGSLTDDDIAKYISISEKIIDEYVGWQNKFFPSKVYGKAESGTTTTLKDSTLSNFVDKFFNRCWVRILEGKNAGEERYITDWNGATHTLSVDVPFTSAIDNTSIYLIEQRSKFPRDVDFISKDGIYYTYIPVNIKIATCIQTEWIIKKGKDFILEGGDRFISENIGDYSYSKTLPTRGGIENMDALVCPQAKPFLRFFSRKTGRIVV